MRVRDNLGDLSLDEGTTVKPIWNKHEGSDGISVAATAVSGLLLEIRTSVFHKSSGNFDQLGDYKLLKTVPNQWHHHVLYSLYTVRNSRNKALRYSLSNRHRGQQSICGQKPTGVTGRGHQKDRYKPPRLATELCNSRLTNLMAATPIKLV